MAPFRLSRLLQPLLGAVLLASTAAAARRRQMPQRENKPEIDYYGVLGLTAGPDTTDSAIKSSYRKLSRQLHPDLNPDPAVKEKYAQVQEAYGVLSDRKKRKVFDIMGHEGLRQLEEADKMGGRRQHDPFASFFGFGAGSSGPQRGPDMEFTIRVPLEDVYNGAEHVVPLRKQTLKSFDVVRTCMKCKAQPPKLQKVQIGPGMVMQQQVPPDCSRQCGARGAVSSKLVQMEVNVERGVPEGQLLKYELEADEYPDRLPGDVKFTVETPPHRTFRRDGDNLHMKLSISLLEALNGFEKEFTHMDGHKFSVERDTPTPHGFELVLPGEGMPKHNVPSELGDLTVTFEVRFPHKLSEEQKDGFRRLLS
eukprot:TRINITY_DN31017_c0_g1_i1.p2 TRINITY_DN31017_c0_g1~~TRINITY_DN31017_c0_g1_i1.p2  ORF type:complete len:365 (+),score=114.17 TRINITY_DN31017_c0_g1_i1:65-1159(+)